MYEYIRQLVDQIFEYNPGCMYTTEGLSREILDVFGEYFSSKQVYSSIKELDYDCHHYTRDVGSKPYFYEKIT